MTTAILINNILFLFLISEINGSELNILIADNTKKISKIHNTLSGLFYGLICVTKE